MHTLPFCRFRRTFLPALFLLATIALFAKFNYPLPVYADILLWASRLDPMLWLGYARNGEVPVWTGTVDEGRKDTDEWPAGVATDSGQRGQFEVDGAEQIDAGIAVVSPGRHRKIPVQPNYRQSR